MVGCGLVECALPEGGEVVERIGEVLGAKALCVNIEDRYLCTLYAAEGICAAAGDKDSVVGIAPHIGTHGKVLCKQGYVAQSVVIALACRSNNSYAVHTFREQVFDGLSLVICLLVGLIDD